MKPGERSDASMSMLARLPASVSFGAYPGLAPDEFYQLGGEIRHSGRAPLCVHAAGQVAVSQPG